MSLDLTLHLNTKPRTLHLEATILGVPFTTAGSGQRLSFHCFALLHEGNSTVYKGVIEGVEVVCKLVREDYMPRIEHEANVYATKLKDLQGDVVPRFFGLFKGSDALGSLACLLLEYRGTAHNGALSKVHIEIR